VETHRLSLVREDPAAVLQKPRSLRVLALGALILGVALVATLLGADAARVKTPSRELAKTALARSLEEGSADEEVQQTLRRLRGSLATHPLDTSTRVVYAGLLLGLSRQLDDMAAAAFHAELAAELSPVTVPVVRAASIVLARSGRRGRAVELIRFMFGHDPNSAAELLLQLETMLFAPELRGAIADDPTAWAAWSRKLDRAGRSNESWQLLRDGHARWPDDLQLRSRLAAKALRRNDVDVLDTLFGPPAVIPPDPRAAMLLTYRARWHQRQGRRSSAIEDVTLALELAPDQPRVRVLAGDAFSAIGEIESARRCWTQVLHTLPRDDGKNRRRLLVSLARLEDRHGQPATALRLWRSVLEVDPDHVFARRRIDELSGFNP